MLTQQDIEELEKMAIDVCGLIQTAKNSCENQDYIPETITLGYAINIQNEIIDRLF
jgi:hypothetical protein